ncbi:MAG: aminopeptidase N [Pseudomonadota bacterium]
MTQTTAVTVRRGDYRPTEYATDSIELTVELTEEDARVCAVQQLRRRLPLKADERGRLHLDGQDLELESVAIDGQKLSSNAYRVDDQSLALMDLPDAFELTIVTRIYPQRNTSLEGLYRSSHMFCTQCEAEGFRKITYYQDRPDVLARFTTRIRADAERYPTLLANGNLIADEQLGDGRREVVWEDPYPKPSYLFALVAGDLASVEDRFTTASGRDVRLIIYSEPHNIDQCHYAMGALKRSMRWDEERYGREYDLDLFMIVAVDDFNMGAMENKGLNIFNTSCVLATPDTATDAAHQRVEAVVAHEYFHNWSGNRVTCRDWFQLSLKEGFTVYRDAQFSADQNGATAKRIEDVNFLRADQFAEDAGPLAHPVRPESYQEISNFYTMTVYEKGAEVVRMIDTLLGPESFRRGSDLYFDRHDGEAATVEDFVRAMEAASNISLERFRRWYSQAGTPELTVRESYVDGCLTLDFAQSLRPTEASPNPEPLHLPILLGFVDPGGQVVDPSTLELGGSVASELRSKPPGSVLAHLLDAAGTLTVTGFQHRPVVSLLRGFSTPVRVNYERPADQLRHLVRHDADGFARWDALQTVMVDVLTGSTSNGDDAIVDLFADLLSQALEARGPESLSLYANMLHLPSETYLFEQTPVIDVAALISRRDALETSLAVALEPQWRALRERYFSNAAYEPTPEAMAQRSLSNQALNMLTLADPAALVGDDVLAQLRQADNLTERMAALSLLCNTKAAQGALLEAALDDFYERWKNEALVLNQWFQVQATSRLSGVDAVTALVAYERFDALNPNRARSVIGAFAQANARNFHQRDGAGYRWLAEQVLPLDASNPQLAARLVQPLVRWQRFAPSYQRPMRAALESLMDSASLSNDLYEIVSKGLAASAQAG